VAIETLVLGIGNVLWADEGFGVRAVHALNEGWRFPEPVVLMDGGTQGLYLLPFVQSARRMIVFDAIDYGLAPGTLHVVRDDDIPSYLGIGKMSLHQSSFQEVLSLAKFSGKAPESAFLIGVQPELLMDYGGSLTQTVRARIPDAIDIALEQLAAWGWPGRPRQGESAPPLSDASLAMDAYETGRPSAQDACRIGDARVLARRAANES
jgi:hydrogenase maturation protease